MDIIKRVDDPEILIVGILNPALAALKYFQNLEIPVNEESFYEVARQLEDYTGEGFVVEGAEEIQKLAEIGNFVVCSDFKGVVSAHTSEEWLNLNETNRT